MHGLVSGLGAALLYPLRTDFFESGSTNIFSPPKPSSLGHGFSDQKDGDTRDSY